MKIKGVSIIIPLHRPDALILDKVIKSLQKQDFRGNIGLIKVDKGFGLAKSLNYGINKAKYNIIVSLHQDCIPNSKSWLKTLVKPLENEKIMACCSKVYDTENKKFYQPLLDEKGCAYKKQALERVGLFDDKTFLNSGEDFDMYIKLKKLGKIAYPGCIVEHHHPGYLIKKTLHKKKQNANTYGCLFRIYGLNVPGWWKALILANIFNWNYFYWFWKGFLKKKQDYKA